MTIRRKAAIATSVAATAGLLAATAMAAKPADNTRPGWGFGDKNHIHTGPPGQSVNVNSVTITNTNNQTATSGDASVTGNTTGGNATSGNTSNTNSTTNNVTINNNH